MRLVEHAQHFIADKLSIGDYAIDATVGNGHDILFLSKQVGDEGHVYGFDIQQQAIQRCEKILKKANLGSRTTLFRTGHENMMQLLPDSVIGHCKAVMFNLGYLPCSDKSIITLAKTTLPALDASLKCLITGGRMTITVYKAHDGGTNEYNSVMQWLEHIDRQHCQLMIETDDNNPLAPELILLSKY